MPGAGIRRILQLQGHTEAGKLIRHELEMQKPAPPRSREQRTDTGHVTERRSTMTAPTPPNPAVPPAQARPGQSTT